MANEFKITANIVYASTSGAGLKETISPGTDQFSQTTIGKYGGMQNVGTSSTTIEAIAEAANPGVMYIRNLDATNFVTYGSSLLEFKLPAGRFHITQISTGATVQIKADTAAVNVDVRVWEV